jgi:hypothetical protein
MKWFECSYDMSLYAKTEDADTYSDDSFIEIYPKDGEEDSWSVLFCINGGMVMGSSIDNVSREDAKVIAKQRVVQEIEKRQQKLEDIKELFTKPESN